MGHATADDLGAYLRGDLPIDRLHGTAAHLAACERCRERLLECAALDRLLRVASAEPSPSSRERSFVPADRLRRELRRDTLRRRLRALRWALPLKLALFLVLRRAARGSPLQLASGLGIAVVTAAALRQLVAPRWRPAGTGDPDEDE